MSARPADDRPLARSALIALLGLSLCAYGLGIWQLGYHRSDELFYMRSARTMLETGRWLYPVYEGEIRFQKPPGAYWLVALSYRLFGVSVAAARLPSVLLAVLGLLLAARLARRCSGQSATGPLAAAALAASYGYALHARLAMTDMLLSVSLLGALLGFVGSVAVVLPPPAMLGWLALAASFLAKGPLGPATAVLALALAAACERRNRRATEAATPTTAWRLAAVLSPLGIAGFVVLTGGWALALARSLPAEQALAGAQRQLAPHLGPTDWGWLTAAPYYGWAALRSGFPWSALLVVAALLRGRRPLPPATRLLALWVLAGTALLAVGTNKHRLRYLVPLLPPLAVLSALALESLLRSQRLREHLPQAIALGFGLWAALFAIGGLLVLAPLGWLLARPPMLVAALALCATGLAGGLWLVRAHRRAGARTIAFTGSAMIVAGLGLYAGGWVAAARTYPSYEIGRSWLRGLDTRATIATVGLDVRRRSLLVLGADHELLPRRDENDTKAIAALLEARPDRIVATAPALERLAPALRTHYRVLARVPGDRLNCKPKHLWKLLRGQRRAAYDTRPPIVVLARRAVAASPPASPAAAARSPGAASPTDRDRSAPRGARPGATPR